MQELIAFSVSKLHMSKCLPESRFRVERQLMLLPFNGLVA